MTGPGRGSPVVVWANRGVILVRPRHGRLGGRHVRGPGAGDHGPAGLWFPAGEGEERPVLGYSESMGHTGNICGLVVRARRRPPVQEIISPKLQSTSSKATRAYRRRGLPFWSIRLLARLRGKEPTWAFPTICNHDSTSSNLRVCVFDKLCLLKISFMKSAWFLAASTAFSRLRA
jgi:hypothetical protein